jgi:hypothetical protein
MVLSDLYSLEEYSAADTANKLPIVKIDNKIFFIFKLTFILMD